MKSVEIHEQFEANVTQMRDGAAFGSGDTELVDGNMIPRLCSYAGEGACAKACQLDATNTKDSEGVGKLCAEKNILTTLAELQISPENFAMVSATKDRIGFGDELEALGSFRHPDGYTMVPECNAFFFRPGVDITHNRHRQLLKVAMRMADCGDVIITGKGRDRQDFAGIAHFSRTNMRGPSAYMHELAGKKVSWGEYVLGSAIEHYGADPASLRVKLVAAVEREDFVHHYSDQEAMEKHFPGWNELGFMHPQGEADFDCLIDYREMIAWQLKKSIQDSRYRLAPEQVDSVEAINTGDLALGHASHHKATHGEIAYGRDMYLLGLNKRKAVAARIDELEILHAGQEWTMNTFGEMSDDDYFAFEKLWAESGRELARLRAVQQKMEGEKEANL